MLRLLLLTLTLANAILASPIFLAGQCDFTCSDEGNKFSYEVGKEYEYDYNIVTNTGNDKESAGINLRATAVIQPVSTCKFLLQMKNVDSEGLEGVSWSSPLYFSWNDGVITKVCVSEEENTDVLNIKRGLLSSLQNSMASFEQDQTVLNEVDIIGECETDYKVKSGWGYTETIEKSRKFNTCNRISNNYVTVSGSQILQDLPLIKSQHSCTQTVSRRLMQSSVCQEEHKFEPYQGVAVTTTSKQVLTLKNQRKASSPPYSYNQQITTLMYDASTTEGNLKNTLDTLLKLELETKETVDEKQASTFSTLISLMKTLNYEQIQSVYAAAKTNVRQNKFFLDALPTIGTKAGIKMMKEILNKNILCDLTVDVWFTSLGFTLKPSEEFVEEAISLLDDNPRKQAFLGISALINQFCKTRSDCANEQVVQTASRILKRHLGSSCSSSSGDVETVVILKALGNIGHFDGPTQDTLLRCVYDENNRMEVRTAAIEAFRQASCPPKPLRDLYPDTQVDTQLRISSYLLSFKCSDRDLVYQIKRSLESEPVNQVGSFVWTHLTNLNTEGSLPRELDDVLESELLRQKYNDKALKLSTNYRKSLKWSEMGAGVESNVIFSNSFLPKSLALNLTVDLFGETIDLFEVGGRFEEFEQFANYIFGPDGYYPQEYVAQFLQGLSESKKGKSSEIDSFTRMFSRENKVPKPSLPAYIKMFGNDIAYENLLNIENVFNGDITGQFLDKLLRQEEIDFTKALQFIDAKLSMPMGSGLPLSLTLNGKTILRVLAQAHLNTDRLYYGDFEINGHVKPSAVIEMAGEMSVEAGNHKSGLQLQTTLKSNMAFEGSIIKEKGKLLTAKLTLPPEKMQVFEMTSKMFVLTKQGKDEVKYENVEENKLCSPASVSKALGIELCGEVSYNNVAFYSIPFYPFKLSLYLQKTDIFRQYSFEYSYNSVGDAEEMLVLFDTPGSRVDRKYKLLYKINKPPGTLELALETPFKSVRLSGGYNWSRIVKKVGLSVVIDNEEILGLDGSLKALRKGIVAKYQPNFTIRSKYGRLAQLTGSISVIDAGKLSMDITLHSSYFSTITIRANMKKSNELTVISVSLDSGMLAANFRSKIANGKEAKFINAFIEYEIAGSERQHLLMSTKYSNSQQASLREYIFSMHINTSAYPEYDVKVDWDLQTTPGHCETSLSLNFGDTKCVLSSIWSNRESNTFLRLRFICPKHKIDKMVEIQREVSDDNWTTTARLKLNPDWELSAITAIITKFNPLKYSIRSGVSYPGNDINFMLNIMESNPRELTAETNLQLSEDWKLNAAIICKDKSINSEYHVGVTARVILPHSLPITLNAEVYYKNIASGSVKLDYKGNIYSLEGNFIEDAETELRIDVKLPSTNYRGSVKWNKENLLTIDVDVGRHIIINAYLRKTESHRESKIEIVWDTSKKATLLATVKPTELEISLAYPHREITFKASTSKKESEASLSWGLSEVISIKAVHTISSISNFKVDVTVTTPFNGYLYQTAGLSFQLQDNGLLSKLYSEYNGRSTVMDLQGQIVDKNKVLASLLLQTGFTNIDAQLEYTQKASTTQLHAKLNHDNNIYSLNLNAETNDEITLQLDLTTSLYFLQNLVAEIRAARFNDEAVLEAYGSYNNHFVKLNAEASYQNQNKALKADAKAKFKSSFTSEKQMSITLTKQKKYVAISADVECSNKGKAALRITSTMKSENEISGQISLILPHSKVTGEFDYEKTPNSLRFTAQSREFESKISLVLNGDKNLLNGNLYVNIPWFQHISVVFEFKKLNAQYTGIVNVLQNEKNILNARSIFTILYEGSWKNELMLKIINLDQLSVQTSHTQNEHVTEIQLNQAPIASLNLSKGKLNDIHGTLKATMLSGLKLAAEYKETTTKQYFTITLFNSKNNKEEFSVENQIEYEPQGTRGVFTLHLSNSNPIKLAFTKQDKSGELKIKSGEESKLLISYTSSTDETKLEINNTFIYLVNALLLVKKSSVKFVSKLENSYEANIYMEPGYSHVFIKTPTHQLTELTGSLNYDADTIVAKLSGYFNAHKIDAFFENKINGGKLELSYNSVVLDVSYDYSYTFTVSLTNDSKTYTTYGKFQVDKEMSKGEISLLLKTPTNQKIQLQANFDLSQVIKVGHVRIFGWNESDEMSFNFKSEIQSHEGNASINLRTPFVSIKKLTLSANYNFFTKKAVDLQVNFNDKLSKLKLLLHTSSLHMSAQTPSSFIDVLIMKDLEKTDKLVKLVVNLNGEENKVYATWNLESVLVGSSNIGFTLPSLNLEQTTLQLEYNLKQKAAKIEAISGNKTIISAHVKLLLEITRSELEADFLLPSTNFQLSTLIFIDISQQNKIAALKVIYNEQVYTFSSELTLKDNLLQLLIKTPLQDFQKIFFKIGEEITNSTKQWFIVYKNQSQYKIILSTTNIIDTFGGSIDIAQNDQEFHASARIRKKRDLDFRVTTSEKKIELSGGLTTDETSGKLTAHLTLKTPWPKHTDIQVELYYLPLENGGEIEVEWDYKDEAKTIKFAWEIKENSFNAKLKLPSFKDLPADNMFTIDINKTSNSLYIQVVTPFDYYKNSLFSAKWNFETFSKSSIDLEVQFMEKKYMLEVEKDLTPTNSKLNIKLENSEGTIFLLEASYNITSVEKQATLILVVMEYTIVDALINVRRPNEARIEWDLQIISSKFEDSIEIFLILEPQIMTKGTFSAQLDYEIFDYVNQMKVFGKYADKELNIHVYTRTPEFRSMIFTTKHDYNEELISATGNFEFNGIKTMGYTFKHDTINRKGFLNANSYEDNSNIKYSWTDDNKYEASLTYDDKTLAVIKGDTKTAKITIHTHNLKESDEEHSDGDITIDLSWSFKKLGKGYFNIELSGSDLVYVNNIDYEINNEGELKASHELTSKSNMYQLTYIKQSATIKYGHIQYKISVFDSHHFSLHLHWLNTVELETHYNSPNNNLELEINKGLKFNFHTSEHIIIELHIPDTTMVHFKTQSDHGELPYILLHYQFEDDIDTETKQITFNLHLMDRKFNLSSRVTGKYPTISSLTTYQYLHKDIQRWKYTEEKTHNFQNSYYGKTTLQRIGKHDSIFEYKITIKNNISGTINYVYGDEKLEVDIEGQRKDKAGELTINANYSPGPHTMNWSILYNFNDKVSLEVTGTGSNPKGNISGSLNINGTPTKGTIHFERKGPYVTTMLDGKYTNLPEKFTAKLTGTFNEEEFELKLGADYQEHKVVLTSDLQVNANWIYSIEVIGKCNTETEKEGSILVSSVYGHLLLEGKINYDKPNVIIDINLTMNEVEIGNTNLKIELAGENRGFTFKEGIITELIGMPEIKLEAMYTISSSRTEITFTIGKHGAWLRVDPLEAHFDFNFNFNTIIILKFDLQKTLLIDISHKDFRFLWDTKWPKHDDDNTKVRYQVSNKIDFQSGILKFGLDISFLRTLDIEEHVIHNHSQLTVLFPHLNRQYDLNVKIDANIAELTKEKTIILQTPRAKFTGLILTNHNNKDSKIQLIINREYAEKETIIDIDYDSVAKFVKIVLTGNIIDYIDNLQQA